MAFALMKKSHKESVEKVSLLSKENKINGRLYTANTALNLKNKQPSTKTNQKKRTPKSPKNTREKAINASLMLSV